MKKTGLTRSSLYQLIAKDKFPAQVKLTERCAAWYSNEIQDWINARPRANSGSRVCVQKTDNVKGVEDA